ncbi:hypothetical protein [Cryobacterium sp. HLT2-28]|uniref:hypothetical protein n=1 Tax=Cryobacterium sp. HLT2-28 TaxID=1259146 RepID=UPI00141AD233|nr:hypothetical protein [Cryobacterium sp. HLT2-28]
MLPGWAWVVIGVIGIPALLVGGPLLVIGALKARRRRRRRSAGSGDLRVAGSWDELTDGYSELGFEVPRGTTRLLVAAALESQLAGQQPAGQYPVSAGLTPLAGRVDRAVFNGREIDDDLVEQSWAEALDSLGIAETSAGRLRRLVGRFRIRSRRDWNKQDWRKRDTSRRK